MGNIKNTSGLLISFLLGGAIGGAIALLYAPKSGKHFRNDISRKTNELIEDGRKKTTDTWNGAKEKVENTIESANDFLNSGMEKITRKTERVKDAFKSAANAYDYTRNSKNEQSDIQTDDAEKTNLQMK